MPRASPDGREGDRQIAVAVHGRWLSRLAGVAWWAAFAILAGWSLLVLGMGASAVAAGRAAGWHEQLHLWGLADSLGGQAAQRMADASHRTQPPLQLVIDYGFSVLNLTLAGILIWLRRNDWAARLLAVGMVGTAAVFNLEAHTVYEVLPATSFDAGSHDGYHLVTAVAYCGALLLFPDGKLVPRWRRSRQLLLLAAVVPVVVVLVVVLRGVGRTVALVSVFGVVTPGVGVAAQAYRYRRAGSGDPSRSQSRLLFWALTPALVVSIGALVIGVRGGSEVGQLVGRSLVVLPVGLFRIFQVTFGIIPVAVFVALALYRLWDIDRLLSRTLVYTVLAGFVSAVYVGVVVGIGALLGGVTTENLGLSIVATGIVAIAFQPVQERVQRVADRLVYGQRATPYEVLSQFSERVAETPATEEMVARMARTLAEGTLARRATVWLAVAGELRPAATYPEDDAAAPVAPLAIVSDEIPWIDRVTTAVAVRHHGELFGALSVTKAPGEPLAPTEERLLGDLGRQAGLVLRNVRLTAELLERLAELQASRQRLVVAQDEARRRLERNLHDGAQQHLVALRIQLTLAEGAAEELADGDDVRGLIAEAKAGLGDAIETLRDLARGIYPPLLAAEGLATALAAQGRRAPYALEVDADDIGRYPQDTEAAVYFCCMEAMQNAAKYAGASRVIVHLAEDDGHLSWSVTDDGCGFDPSCTELGSGSQNIRDRVEALEGTTTVQSALGEGTVVAGRIPVEATRSN